LQRYKDLAMIGLSLIGNFITLKIKVINTSLEVFKSLCIEAQKKIAKFKLDNIATGIAEDAAMTGLVNRGLGKRRLLHIAFLPDKEFGEIRV